MTKFVWTLGVLGTLALLVAGRPVAAQGVTTGALVGRIVDEGGAPVQGASLVLTNRSTGQLYVSGSRADGRFNIENVAVGGPYTLRARLIAFQAAERTGITIPLGQTVSLDVTMSRSPIELAPVVVAATQAEGEFGPSRQGATTISDSALRRLPTLDRQFTEFVRLTPQVQVREGGGISVAGQNDRYNMIQLDGTAVNDRFAIGRSGLIGGQANGRAIGFEAVKEYQVVLAPYDVRRGNFTGALINAVTKSGTNQWRATGFYYFRNQDLAGEPLSASDFRQHQYGASLGGPIQRDKLLFFANAEFRSQRAPASGPYIGAPASVGPVLARQSDVDALNAALATYGLPTGTMGLVDTGSPLANLLARFDLQLGEQTQLMFRYTYNIADQDIFSRSSSTNNPLLDLSTVSYVFKNRTHNPTVQLFTNFGNGSSNELLLSWNRIRDRRIPSVGAPLLSVSGFPSSTGTGTYQLESGSERFSQGNELDQDIFELTNNFTFPKGDHRITVGTRNELYRVRNFFAQGSYGVWTFNTLADFQAGTARTYEVAGDLGSGIVTRFTSSIVGFYAQDQWQVRPDLALTYGLRVDVPIFFDQPKYDSRVITDFGDRDVPSGQVLWAPRVGVSWDVKGRGMTQVRGGAGFFTGTPAYVWMSNAYGNSGTGLGRITCGTGTTHPVPPFQSTLPPRLTCGDGFGLGQTLGEVDLIGKDTKPPRVFRANLALDHRFSQGIVGTVEGIYTRGIGDYFIVNRNLLPPVGIDAHGRVMYGTLTASGGSTPTYFNLNLYGPSFNGGVFDLLNTSNNYSFNVTGQLRKRFADRWEGSAAYTYSHAVDVQSFTSSRAISNWRFGRSYSGDQLDDRATRSSFDRPHRVIVTTTYTFPWSRYPTDISLTYVGQSGQPYTLDAGGSSGRGDLNADGSNTNDPIYIPRNAAAELRFRDITGGPTAADQAAAFDQYIGGEPCLNQQRGRIMERNSCTNPWQNFLDLTVRQTLPEFGGNSLSLELGIFNLLNLLNDDWGRITTVGGGEFFAQDILTMVAADLVGSQFGEPIYNFNTANLQQRFVERTDPRDSYQVQLALRYSF
jgi:outer membrane receptor for ferrienterochelin and colicin